MFEIDKAIDDWKRALRKFEAIEDGAAADLELQLRDAPDCEDRWSYQK